jgi:kynureninase
MDHNTVQYAREQDENDPLRRFRDSFIIPSKDDLSRKTLRNNASEPKQNEKSTYLCGNSLGLQPVYAKAYMQQYLDTWAIKGVYGHFKNLEDSKLAPWMDVDDNVVEDMSRLVGAMPSEVAVMQTLTMNLHLMFAALYKPTKERWKIILEGKAFPSDHVGKHNIFVIDSEG